MKNAQNQAPITTNTPERIERLAFLKKAVREFKTEDFGTPETGNILTVDFGKAPRNGKPETYPKRGAHPRVLFNENDVSAIRSCVENAGGSTVYAKFCEYLSMEISGLLPEPTKNNRGFHNWDGTLLAAIQAQAMAYAVWGDEYYGYSAIYAIKNFLLTLDVDYIFSDQCREFGMVMYIAACVYDWCYPLLSEDDKIQIPLGVEHRLCRGTVKNTRRGILTTSSPVKMEMGFPPRYQAALVGHGSEYQLQRDFLAMAIAVYDELPSWYEFIGGRYFNEYVKPRRKYYEAHLYPQGMSCYAPWRFGGDCCGAALIQAATGTSPYSTDMAKVIFTFVSNETTPLNMFSTGDGASTKLPRGSIAESALKISHVLYDTEDAPLLRLISEQLAEPSSFICTGVNSLLCTEALIYKSRKVAKLDGDFRDHLPAIRYNGGYVGQYLARSKWGADGAVTMMRIGEMGTANHDHEDAGTFQIHYKGVHSGATGGYNTYGSAEWRYFHQATVGKNGILIFDPSCADYEAKLKMISGVPARDPYNNYTFLNAPRLFYSGGQLTCRIEPGSLPIWESGRYNRAVVTGHEEGYEADGRTPKFAYIAGDISRAYQTSQAFYVARSMFTLFTGNEKYPMAMFVFDKIFNGNENAYQKFVLQVNGEGAPIINEADKTVKIENGEGQLVLQSLIGSEKIEGIGGGNGKNRVINGVSCQDNATMNFWGRVELSEKIKSYDSTMLNVIYVSDKGNEEILPATQISAMDAITKKGVRLIGAKLENNAVLFANSTERLADGAVFTVPGEGTITYYVGGLLTGKWTVSYGDVTTSCIAKEESGLISFTAPAGVKITISMQ